MAPPTASKPTSMVPPKKRKNGCVRKLNFTEHVQPIAALSPPPAFQNEAEFETILDELGVSAPVECELLSVSDVEQVLGVPKAKSTPEKDVAHNSSVEVVYSNVNNVSTDSDVQVLHEVIIPSEWDKAVAPILMYPIMLCAGKLVFVGYDVHTMETCFVLRGDTANGVRVLRLTEEELTLLMGEKYQNFISEALRSKKVGVFVEAGGVKCTIQKQEWGGMVVAMTRPNSKSFMRIDLTNPTWCKLGGRKQLIGHVTAMRKGAEPYIKMYIDQSVYEAALYLKEQSHTKDFLLNHASPRLFIEAWEQCSDDLILGSQLSYYQAKSLVDYNLVKKELIEYQFNYVKERILQHWDLL